MRLPTFIVASAGCGCPKIAAQRSIVSMRWHDHSAVQDAIAHHATKDVANLGANLFMYGIHDIIDEVKLVFFQVLRDLVSTPDFYVYTMCVDRVYTCVYICLHIYIPTLRSLHVCVCVCACLHVHTLIYMCVCTYVHICMSMGVCIFLHHVCVCVCIYIHVSSSGRGQSKELRAWTA